MADTLDLTAGGRLTVHPFVTERKLLAMTEMVKGAKLGGYAGQRARTDLQETLSTSDGPFAWTHLVNLRNLPLYDKIEDNYDAIVEDELVPDFNPARFFALRQNWKGLEYGKDNDGQRIAPQVAELDTYQYAYGYTQVNASLAVEKRGFKVGISLEKAVNDVFNLIQRFPGDMLKVGNKTDQYVVIRALTSGVTATSQFDAGDTDYISGTVVGANPSPTPAALRIAIRQIGKRTDADGVKVPIPSSFYLVVATGAKESIAWNLALAQGLVSITDGSVITKPTGPGAVDNLSRIAGVIESEFVGANFWYLVPAKGTTEVPAIVRVSLTGYTAPEVYVSNFNGTPVAGGASASPFQAFHFDNDSVDLKFRMFRNAALFSEDAIVWSNGTNA
jgi:hypothetical protein